MTQTGSSRELAHGVGGLTDLPIPAHYAFIAAALALLISFGVLGLAWREPRFRGDDSGRPLPAGVVRIVGPQHLHQVPPFVGHPLERDRDHAVD